MVNSGQIAVSIHALLSITLVTGLNPVTPYGSGYNPEPTAG
jgi:hypothetical protein